MSNIIASAPTVAPLCKVCNRLLPDGSLVCDVPTCGTDNRPGVRSEREPIDIFTLDKRFTSGGMGEVWQAHETSNPANIVVLKFLIGVEDQGREYRLLTRLRHNHIAHLHSTGTTAEGTLYFVMAYVKGLPLVAHCNQQSLNIAARIGLLRQVCSAVQYMHSQGVMHGDLKPDNILVETQPHGQALAKVIDLGIAIDLGETGTKQGSAALTPDYAAPEQFQRSGLCWQTDVYALGVILHQLLADTLPLDTKGLSLDSITTAQRPPPSLAWQQRLTDPQQKTTLTALAKQWQSAPEQLKGQIEGDLDAICQRALQPQIADRYQTIAEMDADLARHLAHEPLDKQTRPHNTTYLFVRFVQRHRGAVAAAAAILLCIALGIGGTIRYAQREAKAKLEADKQRDIALATAQRELAAKQEAERQRIEADKQRDIAVQADNAKQDTLANGFLDRAIELSTNCNTDIARAAVYTAKALRLAPQKAIAQRLAFSLLNDLRHRLPLAPPWELGSNDATTFSPDGQAVAISTTQGLQLIDLGKRQVLPLHDTRHATGLSLTSTISPSGGLLNSDGLALRYWKDWRQATQPPTTTIPGPLAAQLQLAADGSYAAMPGFENMSEVLSAFNQATGEQIRFIKLSTDDPDFTDLTGPKSPAYALLALPSGHQFLSVHEDGQVARWDPTRPSAQNPTTTIHTRPHPQSTALSADGQWLAIGSSAGQVALLRLTNATFSPGDLHYLSEDRANANDDTHALSFSQDGSRLAVGVNSQSNGGSTARFWNMGTLTHTSYAMYHSDWIEALSLSPDASRLAILCDEGDVYVHDRSGQHLRQWKAGRQGRAIHFLPDGLTLAVATGDGRLALHDTAPQPPPHPTVHLPGPAAHIACIPDSHYVATQCQGIKGIQWWDARSLTPLGSSPHAHADTHYLLAAKDPASGQASIASLDTDGGVKTSSAPAQGTRLIAQQKAAKADLSASLMFGVLGKLMGQDTTTSITIPLPAEASWAIAEEPQYLLEAKISIQTDNLAKIVTQHGDINPSDILGLRETLLNAGVMTGEIILHRLPSLEAESRITTTVGIILPTLSADGNTLAAVHSGHGSILCWQRAPGTTDWRSAPLPPQTTSSERLTATHRLSLSRDGSLIIAQDGETLRVLDRTTAQPTWQTLVNSGVIDLETHDHLAAIDLAQNEYSARIQILDVRTHQTITPIFEHPAQVNAMRFSPDGSLLATGDADGTIRLWDIALGRLSALPANAEGAITTLTFSSDGQRLFAGSENQQLLCLIVPPAQGTPAWAAEALEALGGEALDSHNSQQPTALASLYHLASTVTPAPAKPTAWQALAESLFQPPGPSWPGMEATQATSLMREAERLLQSNNPTAAFVHLRDCLRQHPSTPIPTSLKALADLLQPHPAPTALRSAGSLRQGPAGLRLHWCPPGSFIIGSPVTDPFRQSGESPRTVHLSTGFWISETEITQAQWTAIMGESAYDHAKQRAFETDTFPFGLNRSLITCAQWHAIAKPEAFEDWKPQWFRPECPMIFVTWADTKAFCTRLSQALAHTKAKRTSTPLCRLPSEAEWEYACRAGTTTVTPAGQPIYSTDYNVPILGQQAWYAGNAASDITGKIFWKIPAPADSLEANGPGLAIHPVGQKHPNPWGLYDMLGNVQEWCQNQSGADPVDGEVDPLPNTFAESSNRITRGGSFFNSAAGLRCAARYSEPPTWRAATLGFRIIIRDTLDPSETDLNQPSRKK